MSGAKAELPSPSLKAFFVSARCPMSDNECNNEKATCPNVSLERRCVPMCDNECNNKQGFYHNGKKRVTSMRREKSARKTKARKKQKNEERREFAGL